MMRELGEPVEDHPQQGHFMHSGSAQDGEAVLHVVDLVAIVLARFEDILSEIDYQRRAARSEHSV